LKFLISKLVYLPPNIFLRKSFFFVKRKLKLFIQKRRDIFCSTFIQVFSGHLTPFKLDSLYSDINSLPNIVESYLEHKFDLLGSGWIENKYNLQAYGCEGIIYSPEVFFSINLINKSNRKESSHIRTLIDDQYAPIDWQRDFKSGYRWSESKWYGEQRVDLPGVDIKVPWELGRLQHLPQLAILALSAQEKQEQIIKEFKNQVLDFISMNPPRYGVQWVCTMDVGIRTANLLLAYDLLLQIDKGNILDEQFRALFARSIFEHAEHIVNNLEYNEHLTSNHYLSNIAGLLFAAAHLNSNKVTNQWLAFAIQEIISEMRREFYEDGSNFEASTSYHRLSTEIMVYSAALILGLPPEKVDTLKHYSCNKWVYRPKLKPLEKQEYKILDGKITLPDWFVDRLFNAVRFTYDITKPTGEITQIGDNDSGRFFRLSPVGEFLSGKLLKCKYKNLKNFDVDPGELYWDENILNHKTLLAAASGLFDDEIFKTDLKIEKTIVESLAGQRKLQGKNVYQPIRVSNNRSNFINLPYTKRHELEFPDNAKTLTENLTFTAYQGIGLYIFRSSRLYLLISAGPNGQNGNGGHAHNDKLSFELNIDGKDIFVDPGTYLYTPFPDVRNMFRSTKVHNTIYVEGEEQNEWLAGKIGLFFMKNQSKCYLLDYGDNFIDLAIEYRDIINRRKFIIEDFKLVIESFSNREFKENFNEFGLFSNGYGKLMYDHYKYKRNDTKSLGGQSGRQRIYPG